MLVPPAHDKPQLITCDVGSQSVRTEGAALQTMGGEKEARGRRQGGEWGLLLFTRCYGQDGDMRTGVLSYTCLLTFSFFLPSFLND